MYFNDDTRQVMERFGLDEGLGQALIALYHDDNSLQTPENHSAYEPLPAELEAAATQFFTFLPEIMVAFDYEAPQTFSEEEIRACNTDPARRELVENILTTLQTSLGRAPQSDDEFSRYLPIQKDVRDLADSLEYVRRSPPSTDYALNEDAKYTLATLGISNELFAQFVQHYHTTHQRQGMTVVLPGNYDENTVEHVIDTFMTHLWADLSALGMLPAAEPNQHHFTSDHIRGLCTPPHDVFLRQLFEGTEIMANPELDDIDQKQMHNKMLGNLIAIGTQALGLPAPSPTAFYHNMQMANENHAPQHPEIDESPALFTDMPLHIAQKVSQLFSMPEVDKVSARLDVVPLALDAVENNFKAVIMDALAQFNYAIPDEAAKLDWSALYHNPAAMQDAYRVVETYGSQARIGTFEELQQHFEMADKHTQQEIDNPYEDALMPTAALEHETATIAALFTLPQIGTPRHIIEAGTQSVELAADNTITPNNERGGRE